MTTYDTLRHFADSHGLVVMAAFFVFLCAWPFRPGSRQHNHTAANMIFEDNEDGQ